jgi:hypothetical protein
MTKFNFTAKVDMSNFQRDMQAFAERIDAGLPRIVAEATRNGVAAATPHIPVDTGKLESKGTALPVRAMRGRADGGMSWPVKYASIVDGGARPHWIQPKAATGFHGPVRESQTRRRAGAVRKKLHWVGNDGEDVFRTKVHHPGSTGVNFTRHALNVCTVRMTLGVGLLFDEAQQIFRRRWGKGV